jgi:hypothetical protein
MASCTELIRTLDRYEGERPRVKYLLKDDRKDSNVFDLGEWL